jgi:YD repeat-containing protein
MVYTDAQAGTHINADNNYGYTAIGELERDNMEEIQRIEWRVDSKISRIVRTADSEKKSLEFEYDAMGNRIAKHVYEDNSFTFESLVKSTYYVRDASGNVMGTYEHTPDHTLDPPTVTFTCTERPIYGSSRVGMDVTKVVYTTETEALPEGEAVRLLGNKQYEISNHLGNVLVVVSDVKVIVQEGGTITGYEAQISSATDYSPFGAVLEGRTDESESQYRYGFNGQEKETEITGTAAHTSAEFWMHDSRLGRRWDLDPRPNSNFSPYSSFQLNPIFYFDAKGDTVGGDLDSYNTVKDYCKNAADELGKSSEGIKKQISTAPTTGASINVLKNELNRMEVEKSEFNSILEEYKALEESTEYYEIIVRDQGELTEGSGGSTGFNSNTCHVEVVISSTMPIFEALPHELKHAYQFETEKLDFSYKGGGGETYDIIDEVEAYQRGQFFGYYSGKTIDAAWVLLYGKGGDPSSQGSYDHLSTKTSQIGLSSYYINQPFLKQTYKEAIDISNQYKFKSSGVPNYIYKGSKRK